MTKLKNIFEANYSPLCNYASALINDPQASEDIVQSVFIQLWENDKLTKLEVPAPYLIRCVKYKCIDYIRRQKGVKIQSSSELPDVCSIDFWDLTEEDIEPIFAYLTSQLPPKTRRVFLMRRKQGMSYKEIAEELDVSIKTIENQMTSAQKKMKTMLLDDNIFPAFIIFFEYFCHPN